MSTFDRLNGVIDTSIATINGVLEDDVATVNGSSLPGGGAGATRWVVATAVEYVGYAANNDLTSWTFYDRMDSGTPDALDIAYGKDSSGNGIYVVSNDSSTKEIAVSSTDITDGNSWTQKDLSGTGNDQFVVVWAAESGGATAGIWMCAGQNGGVFRSTDGAANWSEIDMSSVTNYDTTKVTALASDGFGNWIIGQEDRIYSSTNNGASFSLVHTFPGSDNITKISGAAYTNNSWVIAYERSTDSSKTYLRSCASNNLSTWGAEGGGGALSNYGSGNLSRTTIVADNLGRILIVPHNRQRAGFADVNGTVISNFDTYNMNIGGANKNMRDAATDGSKWLICGQDGYIWESTDNAETWTIAATNIRNSTDDMNCITADVYLPLT